MTDRKTQDPLDPADIRDGLRYAAAQLVDDRDRMEELLLLGNVDEMLIVNTSVLIGLAVRLNGDQAAALDFLDSVVLAHPEQVTP